MTPKALQRAASPAGPSEGSEEFQLGCCNGSASPVVFAEFTILTTFAESISFPPRLEHSIVTPACRPLTFNLWTSGRTAEQVGDFRLHGALCPARISLHRCQQII